VIRLLTETSLHGGSSAAPEDKNLGDELHGALAGEEVVVERPRGSKLMSPVPSMEPLAKLRRKGISSSLMNQSTCQRAPDLIAASWRPNIFWPYNHLDMKGKV